MHIISHSQLYIVISPYIITKYEMKMRLKEKNIDRNFNSQEFITVKKKNHSQGLQSSDVFIFP